MPTRPSFIQRVRDFVEDLFPGRRLTNGAVINGTAREVTTAHSDNQPEKVTTKPDLVTPFATSYAGSWSLQRLVARNGRGLKALRDSLLGAAGGYARSVRIATMYLARIELPTLKKEYEEVIATSHSRDARVRGHHLPLPVYLAILVVVAVVDWFFFYSLLMDVQAASPSDPGYWQVVVQSAGLATLTPLAVLVLSEWGGRRLSRTRTEVRDVLDGMKKGEAPTRLTWISIFMVPAVLLALLAALVALFAAFAQHRFEGLTSGIGAVNVDPALLTVLIAILPIVAFAASTLHHDLAASHARRTIQKWEFVVATMQANQERIAQALEAWRMSWDSLYDRIGQIVSAANLSYQAWEHLILTGIARANQRGVSAYSLDSVTPPSMDPQRADTTLSTLLDGIATDGKYSVRAPAQLQATSFHSAEWILDELEISLTWLVRHRPDPEGPIKDDIQRLLDLAHPSASAFGTSDTPDTPEKHVPARDVSLETAELERMLDVPSAANGEVK